MDLDPEKALYGILGAIGGLIGGLFTKLILLIFPSYAQLLEDLKHEREENRLLRKENAALREEKEGLEDALDDTLVDRRPRP